ncbi:M48 family metallopeptidase [Nocardioides bigeumensis]|uniref:M48 family metallopeptidase n=1 Tax=Nocardioides bigeumensis TaxID=433657 RepID=A0ABP5JL26_9ACTN
MTIGRLQGTPDRTPGRIQSPDPARRTSLVVSLVGLAVFVGLVVALVPWDPAGTPLRVPSASTLLTADEIARAESYSRAARWTGWGALAISLVAVIWLAAVPRGRRLASRILERLRGPWWVRVVLGVLLMTVAVRVLTLPFAVVTQSRRHDVGLSTQSWLGWARDVATNLLVGVVVTSLVVLVLVACARRWSRAWPVVAGSTLAGAVLLGSFVYPLVVEPLFNSFTSLPDGDLRAQVLAIADREGVPVSDVLVADASRRTTTLNAYVSGFGSTRRVVLYDNLVDDLPEDEALSVVAHELAHAKHRDVLVGSVLGAAGAFMGVGLLGMVLSSGFVRRRLGVTLAAGALAVPLLIALVDLGSLMASPVQNGISRRIEMRADVDALRVTRDPDAFVEMQRMLARRSLSDPTPPALSQWWFGSHPTMLERVALARRSGSVR